MKFSKNIDICRKNDIFLCHFPTYYFTIYKCSINLIVNGKLIDARSPLMIMSAGIKHKTELEIICDGENEDLALEDVKNFLCSL